MADDLRQRATVVVIRDDKVLLVRHREGSGPSDFSMPGGGIEPGESPIGAAARELREETGLEARQIEYLFTWDSSIFRHHAFRVEADGEVEIGLDEISEYLWWDQVEDVPMFGHVQAILERL